MLMRQVVSPQDANRQSRQRFGRAISLDVIERALRNAYNGSMRDVTDLSRETIDTDPHLASVLTKRFRPLGALTGDVDPAEGPGVDEEKAEFYATVVREQLKQMNGFSRMVGRLAWGLWDGRACEELQWLDLVDGPSHPKYGQATLGVANSEWIHPRRLSFGPMRELRIIEDDWSYPGGFREYGLAVRDVPFKFVWWTPQLFGDYQEREGLAQRTMYWSFFKRFGARERMILCELYGKPLRWLEVDPTASVSEVALKDAERVADSLGGTFTARMPRGVKLHLDRPEHDSGKIHQEIIKDTDEQISKLVLGQIGTTQGVASGLNSNVGGVMQDEQGDVHGADANLLSEVIEDMLCDAIIAVNFGPGETTHAPTFTLRVVTPKDSAKETARLKGALDCGLPVRLSEAYEVVGFSQPAEGDPVVRMEQPAASGAFGTAPAARAVIVWPKGKAPLPGELQAPSRAAGSAEPSEEPAEEPDAEEPPEPAEPAGPALPSGGPLGSVLNVLAHAHCSHGVFCVAQQTQPDSANGSPETILRRSAAETNRIMERMVQAFEEAVRGLVAAGPIIAALSRARAQLDLRPLGRSLERRMMHGAALGALDALSEEQEEESADFVAAAIPIDFSSLGFDQMEKAFRSRQVLRRAAYDKLAGHAKQRAFTVAGVVADQALVTIQDELGKQIGRGASMGNFSRAIRRRMEDAGFVSTMQDLGNGQRAMSASHVEVVFRTNVLGAYNAGRLEQMRQPEVIARRPVWEIRSVQDDHARGTHKGANGTRLLATDPFWKTAYPPFGFNCRCRVVSRGPSFLQMVVDGSTLSGLPDEGFASGISSLLSPDVP